MEQIAIRRILDGDQKLFFLVSSRLFVNPLAKKLIIEIGKFYREFMKFPTLEELTLKYKDTDLGYYISNVLTKDPVNNVSAEYIAYELRNQAARNLFVENTIELTKDVLYFDAEEISEGLYKISMDIRDIIESDETVFDPADLPITASEMVKRLPSGLDPFDAVNGGFAPGELILIGGRRGTGKSIFALNLLRNYYHKYDFSVIFFSIEMPKTEVYNRLLSIISGVPNADIVKNVLTDEQKLQIIEAKAREFYDTNNPQVIEFLDKLHTRTDPVEAIEDELKYLPRLPKQFFIVDDATLSISKIDYYISLLQQKSKAPIMAVCVDYLNILSDPEADSEVDWKTQNNLAKQLKTLARQHQMIVIAPNQIDATGKARFAVAIEDHIDCALKFLPSASQKKAGILPIFIDKMRNGRDDFEFQMLVDKDTLQLKNLDEVADIDEEEEDD